MFCLLNTAPSYTIQKLTETQKYYMKKFLIFSYLFAAFAYIALGQGYSPALVSDELTRTKETYSANTIEIKGQCVTYKYRVANNTDFYQTLSSSSSSAFYVTESNNVVANSVELTWIENSGKNKSLSFYGKYEPYTSHTDLYGLNKGDLLGGVNRSSQTSSVDKTDIVCFDVPYRYIGMALESDDVYLKKITVTWQLAHFRDNLTIGKVGTICLPYDVCADDLSDEITAYSIAGKVMDAQEEKVETVVFEAVDKLEAGVPYLFVSKKTDVCLKYSYEESKAGEYPITQAGNKNGLYGSFENHEFTTDECKNNDLFLISNNQINLAGAGSGVGANRAYIKMSEVLPYVEAGSSRKLLLTANGFEEVDGVTTIVPKVATYGNVHGCSTYDLQGRRSFNSFGAGIILQDGRKKFVDGK